MICTRLRPGHLSVGVADSGAVRRLYTRIIAVVGGSSGSYGGVGGSHSGGGGSHGGGGGGSHGGGGGGSHGGGGGGGCCCW